MLTAAQMLNLAMRFAVELVLLAAVTTAAWRAPSTASLRYAAAAAALLLVSASWALIVHNAALPAPARVGFQAAALAVGVGCLMWLTSTHVAAAVAAAALLNAALLAAWNQ